MDAKRSVATKDQAARIAGIRPARVNYWVKTQIVRPSFDVFGAGRRRVQLLHLPGADVPHGGRPAS